MGLFAMARAFSGRPHNHVGIRTTAVSAGLALIATFALASPTAYAATNMAVTIDQCANDQGSGYPGHTCDWVNGNLNSTKTTYDEGDASVQRAVFTGLSVGDSYTYTFTYDTLKSGKHAYDYLTTWNYSQNWVTNLCAGVAGCSTTGLSTYPIAADPSLAGAVGQVFTMSGGTLTGSTAPTYDSAGVATVTVSFTATATTAVLWFGAHVASQLDWGTGMGAGSVSGSPYHVSAQRITDTTSGSSEVIGQQDNQMAASAIQQPGAITITKVADPADGTDFSFGLANAARTQSKTFQLDVDSDPTLPNTVTYYVAPGSWTVQEPTQPAGWSFAGLTCTDASAVIAGSTATVTVASGAQVSCTYSDTKIKYADLQVSKTAVASSTAPMTGPSRRPRTPRPPMWPATRASISATWSPRPHRPRRIPATGSPARSRSPTPTRCP